MRYLIILLCLTANCKAQDSIPFFIYASDSIWISKEPWCIWEMDKNITISNDWKTCATITDSTSMNIYDSLCTIKVLLKSYNIMEKNYTKTSLELWYAKNILEYMNTDGTITDWRKWANAVNKYQEFTNNKQ